jgi:hypothetical protein
MFLFGFLFTFVMIQLWGLPVVYNYLNLPSDETIKTKRWRILFGSSLILYLVCVVSTYAIAGAIAKVWMIINIPAMLYMSIFTYCLGFAIAYYSEQFLVSKKVLNRKSIVWYALAIFWAFLFNVGIVMHYALYFQADLYVPKVTRDYFSGR